jgi:hypothetical protein
MKRLLERPWWRFQDIIMDKIARDDGDQLCWLMIGSIGGLL